MKKFTFCLVLIGANLLGIAARSQFVSPKVPLNNLIAERIYNPGQPDHPGASTDTNATAATPLITDSDASLEFDYTYTRESSQMFVSLPAGGVVSFESVTKINGYNVMPSLFFDIRSNLLVTAGFGYLHQKLSAPNISESFDNYTPFVCADEELLHFLPGIDTARNSLFLGGNFSYTRSVGSGVGVVSSPLGLLVTGDVHLEYNDYAFGPSLVYIRSVADWSDGTPGRAAITLNPAYSYNYLQSPFGLQRNGVVTVLGRVDYGLTRNLYLDVSASWLHRNNIDVNATDSDVGVFGGGLTARLWSQSNHPVLFRLAYGYEAFVKGLESHEVSAQLEVHF